MRLIEATFKTNEIAPGWKFWEDEALMPDLGARFIVDVDTIQTVQLRSLVTGQEAPFLAAYVDGPNGPGFMPLVALALRADG